MILIISSEEDRTTNDVIDWIRYFNKPFKRISIDKKLVLKRIDFKDFTYNFIFEIDGETYNLTDFEGIWYRRSWINFKDPNFISLEDKDLEEEINKQLLTEINTYKNYFINTLETNSLNSPNDLFVNKLNVLKSCAKIGIKTPTTLITSSKNEVIQFKKTHKSIITKNYSQGVFIESEGNKLNSYTLLVSEQIINELDDEFFPMMFQECINKAFELRIFYMNSFFYASAILSQNDEKTKIDFRNYNYEKPNRTPPYQLPKKIEKQLEKLMKELKLNSGSIDLLVDNDGNYIFLEVNPIGQFAQVSNPCNYFLEKKVAEFLCK